MSVVEQFAGLDMKNLIGGPLSAAADASLALANSTADFINKVGFDADGKLRTAAFSYQRRSMNDDGTSNLDEMKVDVPMLAIVPIPNLQVDEVNILFDMEVKQSERAESSTDLSATATGTANISPSLVDSKLKDGNGQDLSDAAKTKAENLKQLRADISNCEGNVTAASNCLDSYIKQLRNTAEAELLNKKTEYNTVMMGGSTAAQSGKENLLAGTAVKVADRALEETTKSMTVPAQSEK